MPPTTAKPPRPLRLNQRAQLVPTVQYAEWHRCASTTTGLSNTDRAILDIIAEHHRQLQTTGHSDRVTVEKMAARIGVEPMSVRSSIKHLIGLCLLGVKPGSGQWPNEYLLALPKEKSFSGNARSPSTGSTRPRRLSWS
jgi:hypothetical protein